MTEAILLVLSYLKENYQIAKVIAQVHKDNIASQKLIQNLHIPYKKTASDDTFTYVLSTGIVDE